MFKWLCTLFPSEPSSNKSGRMSVEDYSYKVKKDQGLKCYEDEVKPVFKVELYEILKSYEDKLRNRGLEVSYKDIVDYVYIVEITPSTWLPEVSLFYYKDILFQISKDGRLY